jgi:hypothetical protein
MTRSFALLLAFHWRRTHRWRLRTNRRSASAAIDQRSLVRAERADRSGAEPAVIVGQRAPHPVTLPAASRPVPS